MLDTILRIIALTRKELLAVLKDRRARMSLLIPPIVQGLIFGYAATYDLNHVPYAVLDQDRTSASRELLAGLDGSGVFERVAMAIPDAMGVRLDISRPSYSSGFFYDRAANRNGIPCLHQRRMRA